jgi:hypothetical protein
VTTEASGEIYNRRPDLIDPEAVWVGGGGIDLAGGRKLLLNRAAFGKPAPRVQGNLGRNALNGPGLASLDVSVMRTFAMRPLGEAGRLTLRADAYNAFNRLNLGAPNGNEADSTGFGVAAYGRRGVPSPFPVLRPLDETPLRVQIILRLSF